MNRKLPPNLYERQYTTRGGYRRTLYCPRFVCWDGKRRTFPGVADFGQAKAELERLLALDRDRHNFDTAPTTATLYPWAGRYLTAKAGPSRERYGFAVAKLKAGLGDMPLEDITHGRLLEYRIERRQTVTDATINRELSSLRSILRHAYHDGALRKLPRIPFVQEHNERTRTVTAEEYRRILRALPADDRQFAEIIYEMGFRPAEILAITPADLVRSERAIDMTRIRKKRGLKRALPLSPRAWAILSQRARGKGKADRLFDFTRHQVRTAFMRACAKLEIKDVWLYDLKATFATEKQRQGWPDKIIMEFTGHRSDYAFRRYSRPTVADLRKFIQKQRFGNTVATQKLRLVEKTA